MYSIVQYGNRINNNILQIYGLSTDEKPLVKIESMQATITNGSTYVCMDTGDVFFYDQENHRWLDPFANKEGGE